MGRQNRQSSSPSSDNPDPVKQWGGTPVQLAHWITHLANDAPEHLSDDANALAVFGINTTSRGLTMYWNKLHFLARQQYDATNSEMLMYSFSNRRPLARTG